MLQDGDSIPTSKKCYTRQCSYDADHEMYVVSETQVFCPLYDELPVCEQVCYILYHIVTSIWCCFRGNLGLHFEGTLALFQ